MDKPLTKEESYAERRLLFKNIWETAMNINDKEDIMNKPKVIKTLRLDQVDRCAIGTKKKQRIKNLRTVCNRILDFCDRQDADDLIYEQMASTGQIPEPKMKPRTRKQKPPQLSKKINATKSLSTPLNETVDPRATSSDRKKDSPKTFKVSRNTSPIKRSTLKKSIYVTGKSLKQTPKAIRYSLVSTTQPHSDGPGRNKIIRKKRTKKKKSSETVAQKGAFPWTDT